MKAAPEASDLEPPARHAIFGIYVRPDGIVDARVVADDACVRHGLQPLGEAWDEIDGVDAIAIVTRLVAAGDYAERFIGSFARATYLTKGAGLVVVDASRVAILWVDAFAGVAWKTENGLDAWHGLHERSPDTSIEEVLDRAAPGRRDWVEVSIDAARGIVREVVRESANVAPPGLDEHLLAHFTNPRCYTDRGGYWQEKGSWVAWNDEREHGVVIADARRVAVVWARFVWWNGTPPY